MGKPFEDHDGEYITDNAGNPIYPGDLIRDPDYGLVHLDKVVSKLVKAGIYVPVVDFVEANDPNTEEAIANYNEEQDKSITIKDVLYGNKFKKVRDEELKKEGKKLLEEAASIKEALREIRAHRKIIREA